MPDNSFGDANDIPTPRGKMPAGGSDAQVLRMKDGRISASEDDDGTEDRSNPHDLGYGLVEVAFAFLIVIVAVVLIVKFV